MTKEKLVPHEEYNDELKAVPLWIKAIPFLPVAAVVLAVTSEWWGKYLP